MRIIYWELELVREIERSAILRNWSITSGHRKDIEASSYQLIKSSLADILFRANNTMHYAIYSMPLYWTW